MIDEEQIRAVATDAAYKRGVRYFRRGAVGHLERQEDGRSYTAVVEGTEAYHVRVGLTETGDEVESFRCDCPAAAQYLGACKHVVAVLKAVQQQVAGGEGSAGTDAGGRRLLKSFRTAEQLTPAPLQEPVYLVPRLFVESAPGKVESWLEFRIGMSRLYVVRNVMEFLQSLMAGEDYPLGRSSVIHMASLRWADRVSKELWGLMKQAYLDEKSLLRHQPALSYMHALQKSTVFEHKVMHLTPSLLAAFLAIMGEQSIELHIDGSEAIDVHLREGKPQLHLDVSRVGGQNGCIRLEDGDLTPLSEDCCLLYQSEGIYRVDEAFGRALQPLWQTFARTTSVQLSHADMTPFFSNILPAVEKIADVDVDAAFEEEFLLVPLAAELYLDYEGAGIAVKPVFVYGHIRFNPVVQEAPEADAHHLLVRDSEAEQVLLAVFARYGFTKKRDQFVQLDEEKSYRNPSRSSTKRALSGGPCGPCRRSRRASASTTWTSSRSPST